MSWLDPYRARPVPVPTIEERAAAMGIPMEPGPGRHCDACKRYRVAEELEELWRGGAHLVICRAPGPCITAALVAGLWKN